MQVGVGAFVFDRQSQRVLMVQEKNGPLRGKGVWKMPTGLSMAQEDIGDAAQREVSAQVDMGGLGLSCPPQRCPRVCGHGWRTLVMTSPERGVHQHQPPAIVSCSVACSNIFSSREWQHPHRACVAFGRKTLACLTAMHFDAGAPGV